jgi:1-acyl-sn-glycerol-3-phosphate acyltransferase
VVGPFGYRIARVILAVVLFLLGPVKVRGKRTVPRSGGLLVLANHLSDCDPTVVGYALPRRVRFMAKSELFDIRFLGWLIKKLGAYPVKRGSPDRAAIRRTIELLKSGECVVMFPEGELSEDGTLQPILPGAELIVRMAGTCVQCAGLKGTDRILPFGKLIPRPAFGGVSVTLGEPRTFDGAADGEIIAWIESELRRLSA